MTEAWQVVPLAGEVDLTSAPELRARLTELTSSPPACLVLDLTDLTFIDSTGLGVLVGGHRRAQQAGGTIRLAGARAGVQRVLSVTGLDTIFQVYRTVGDACSEPLEALT